MGYLLTDILNLFYFVSYAVFGNKKLVVPNNYISKDALEETKEQGTEICS